jgi:hypothetical protein
LIIRFYSIPTSETPLSKKLSELVQKRIKLNCCRLEGSPFLQGLRPLLIGKWKFDVYEPSQRLSNIGPNITTGYSKLFTIEFFEDGSYKYIETNRICPTGRTCCRNNNQLEKGVFSITTGFNFAFKSGDMMRTDECNPTQAAISRMKASDAHLLGMHKWAIGPAGENNVLNFCIEQGGKTICFERSK